MLWDSDINTYGPLHLLHGCRGCIRFPTLALLVSYPRTIFRDRYDVPIITIGRRTCVDRVNMVDHPRSLFRVHRILRGRRDRSDQAPLGPDMGA